MIVIVAIYDTDARSHIELKFDLLMSIQYLSSTTCLVYFNNL